MGTFVQALYQIVFSTKNREKVLLEDGRERIYEYIIGIFTNKKCHIYRIGGIEDHIHIVTHIHPTIDAANLVKDVKLATNKLIKDEGIYRNFKGWQDGYGLFTYHINSKDELIEYVKNQKEHHKKLSFKEELILLLKEHKIEYNEEYLN